MATLLASSGVPAPARSASVSSFSIVPARQTRDRGTSLVISNILLAFLHFFSPSPSDWHFKTQTIARARARRKGVKKKKPRGTPTARRRSPFSESPTRTSLPRRRVSRSLQAKLTAAPMKAVISAAENSVRQRRVNCILFSLSFPFALLLPLLLSRSPSLARIYESSANMRKADYRDEFVSESAELGGSVAIPTSLTNNTDRKCPLLAVLTTRVSEPRECK